MAIFTSLASYLARCFDLPLSALSADQRERVDQDFMPLKWDQLNPDQRREFAQDWDRRNRPMTPTETNALARHFDDLADAEAQQTYWSSRRDEAASDAAIKQSKLKKINKELDGLNAKHKALRGDTQARDTVSTPPPVDSWKMRIQIEATEQMKTLRSAGANPTVHSILSSLVTWCTKNDVRTSTGIIPTSGYLRTHVLSAKHWTPPR